jgi:isopentenyl-diphosphate delta-isomerase
MPEDLLIRVDERDQPIGPDTRAACHSGKGVLHRAFSVYIFDGSGRLLIQQRSAGKQLWPLHWSNSCCSHPRWGEDIDAAAQRRLTQEVGIRTTLRQLFKFQYRAQFRDYGTEHEVCTVYVGVADAVGTVDPQEVADWNYVDAHDLDQRLSSDPSSYTPWLRLAWARLRREHWHEITELCGNSA